MSVWLAGAHYIKGKLHDSLAVLSNDNIELTYKRLSIGGFPYKWKIVIHEPTITLVDQSSVRELSASKANLYFDYGLKSAIISLPKTVRFKDIKPDIVYDYSLEGESEIITKVVLFHSLYLIDTDILGKKSLKSIDVKFPDMKAFRGRSSIFQLKNSALYLTQKNIEGTQEYRFRFIGDYDSSVNHFKINNAHLMFDISYSMRNDVFDTNTSDFDHKLDIHRGLFKFDNASIDVSGVLKLARSRLPNGQMSIAMQQYQDVVDMLVPEDFIVSKPYIRKIIAKAAMPILNKVASNSDVIKFDINFADRGISIGKLNLLELNLNK